MQTYQSVHRIAASAIETDAEAATLLDLDYMTGQGYLFARPMPIDTLAQS